MSTATGERPPTSETPDESAGTRSRRSWRRFTSGLSWLGLVGATLAFGAALTPSLLPRPWVFEGVIAGLGAAIGYGLGVLVSWVVRRTPLREPGAAVKRRAWLGLRVVAPLLAVWFLLLGTGWQNEVRTLVGEPDEGLATAVVVGVVALPVAVGALLVARALRRFGRWVARPLRRVVPPVVAGALAAVVVALALYAVVSGVLLRGFIAAMDGIYSASNATVADGVTQPTTPLRSGSPSSLTPWDTLGTQGRSFVAGGPTVTQLEAFSGRSALQPIRVYAGLDTAPTAAQRAAVAVQELERTGAFSRKVLVVTGTTGTGWLEPQAVDSIEYEWNGDTAIVGIQYSYLPSWISTIVDVDRAREAGRALFDAVYARWSQLPAGHRPMLLAYGLSLGSFSIQSAFTDAADVASRTQGAVFVGSPSFSQPWGEITAARDAGSPQWRPVYQGGRVVRFAGDPADFASPSSTWGPPRVAYVQHANDSVVWWDPALLVEQPDWLREPAGPGRTPTMRWYPVLTFLQVTVDQFVGVAVPQGQGHNYGTSMPAVWAQVSQPPGWTDADTARLDAIVAAMPTE